MIAEYLGVTDVAAPRIHGLVPRHVHHPKHIGAALRCRREEAGPQRMAGEAFWIEADLPDVAFDQLRHGSVGQPPIQHPPTLAERSVNKDIRLIVHRIDRIVDAVAAGVMADAEVRARMDPLRTRRATLEAEIASLPPPPKIVALHPATVSHYLASIDKLAETLARRTVQGHEDVASALRTLIAAVIVHPAEHEPRIEVTGRLAELTGAPALFPQASLMAVVAGGGLEPPTSGL
jgi:hypothetical protein